MKPGFSMPSLLPQAKKGRSSCSALLEKCKDILALLRFRPLVKASCGVQSAGAVPVVAPPVVFAPFVPAVVVPRSLRRIPAGLRPGLLLRMLRRLRARGFRLNDARPCSRTSCTPAAAAGTDTTGAGAVIRCTPVRDVRSRRASPDETAQRRTLQTGSSP